MTTTPSRSYGQEIKVKDDYSQKLVEAAKVNGLDESLAGVSIPVVPITSRNDRFGSTIRDDFWLDDFSILFRPDRLGEFFPATLHTTREQLNACTRFFIYLGALLALYRKSSKPFLLMAAIPSAILAYYYLQCIASKDDHQHEKKSENFDLVQYKSVKPEARMHPTKKNPFMNPDPTMYGTADYLIPPADVNDPQVQKEILDAFESDMWKDEDDLFDRKQGQLQFHTVPRYIDFGAFQDYLYKNPDESCKENSSRCEPPYRSHKNERQTYNNDIISEKGVSDLDITELNDVQ